MSGAVPPPLLYTIVCTGIPSPVTQFVDEAVCLCVFFFFNVIESGCVSFWSSLQSVSWLTNILLSNEH